MNERLKKHIESLTEEERLSYLKTEVNLALKSLKSRNKAVDAEFNFNGSHIKRTASNRGGRLTTLTANAVNCTQIHDSNIETIKQIIKYL